MKVDKAITLRFRHWPNPVSEAERPWATLLEKVLNRRVEIVDYEKGKVDIEIESVYGRPTIPNLQTRTYRMLASHTRKGIDFSSRRYSTNQQPSGKSRFSIFFTGENERPPLGLWDAYLSFDLHSYDGRNAYFPLWWITSTDLVEPVVSPYLGRPITIESMMNGRKADWSRRKKFCAAFVGKAYPFRMQAIAALSKIGRVDVFGEIARNSHRSYAKEKFNIAQEYKFVFAFENDLYPGYVTEKAPEAWATGAVPLYWGSDPEGYLNPSAMLNLADFKDFDTFVSQVSAVNSDRDMWESIAELPLLKRRPNLDQVIALLRNRLRPLVKAI